MSKKTTLIHELKIPPKDYQAIRAGNKTAACCLNEHGFQVGQFMSLREYLPVNKEYTGQELMVLITHVLEDFPGLVPGYVILSIEFAFEHKW